MFREMLDMKTLPRSQAHGFILVTVLFLIAVLTVMVVVMSTTTSVQHLTTSYSLQEAQAFAAARSGLDYGVQRAVSANVCTNGAISLPGISFNVTISCSSAAVNEAGTVSTVYQFSSTASTGTFGNVGYVTRTVRASVTI